MKVLSEAESMAACYPNEDGREHNLLWIAVMPRVSAPIGYEVRRGVARCTSQGCEWAATGDKEEVRNGFHQAHLPN